MKVLTEKLLLEESNFEDTELDTPGVDEVGPESTETSEMGVDTPQEEPPVTDEISAPQTTYKVSYKLGKHSNWSRVDATSEEEAKQTVQDYITSKWPDRKYEFVDIEEFDEEGVSEALNESMSVEYSEETIKSMIKILTSNMEDYKQLLDEYPEDADYWKEQIAKCQAEIEDLKSHSPITESVTDVQPIETESGVGMSMVISDLIKDEYEAIDGYNSAIATAEAEGYGDMVRVLSDIQAEEHIHIGQLHELLKMVDPNASKVEDGQAEGVEQLSDVPPVEPEYEETV